MLPIEVPEFARREHPDHVVVSMGPPPGVADEDCGAAQMLLGRQPVMPGFGGRDQLAYFRPTPEELEVLNRGGYLELNQLGSVVQPFALNAVAVD